MKLFKKVIYPKQKIKAFKFTVKSIFRSSNWLIQKYFLRGDSISNFDVLLFPNLKMAATWKSDKILLCQNHLVTHSTANWLTAVLRKVLGATLIVEKGNSKLVNIVTEEVEVRFSALLSPLWQPLYAAEVWLRFSSSSLVHILRLKSGQDSWKSFCSLNCWASCAFCNIWIDWFGKMANCGFLCYIRQAFLITKHFLLFQH